MALVFRPTRRLVIAGAAALSLGPRIAFARPEDVAYAIRQDFGPFTAVDNPMTAEGYPEGIRLYGSGNPRPHIVTLRFTPLCGRAVFSTRIRLNGAQDVTAIARTSRAEYLRATQPVGVSFGACATAGDSSGLPEN